MTDLNFTRNQSYTIIGPPGSGKSTVLRILTALYAYRDAKRWLIVMDTKRSLFNAGLDVSTGQRPPFTINLSDLGFQLITVDLIDQTVNRIPVALQEISQNDLSDQRRAQAIESWKRLILSYGAHGNYSLLFFFTGSADQYAIPELSSQIAAAIESLGNTLFVVDEASDFIPGGAEGRAWGIRRLVTRGRERGVDLIISTQFLAYTGKISIRSAQNKIIFATNISQDLHQLQNIISDPARVRELQRFEFIFRDFSGSEMVGNTADLFHDFESKYLSGDRSEAPAL